MPPAILTRPAPLPDRADAPRPGVRLVLAGGLLAAATVVLALVHLTQGTSSVGAADILGLLTGHDDDTTGAVVAASRIPRLAAGLLVGAALGAAGAVLQSVPRVR
ncbi:ABC transporter permease, partial [Arthrobacter agilis]